MLDFIADRADLIIAGVQTALTLDMLPIVWHQFRAKASTVPLLSSVPTAVGLAVLSLVFFSTDLYLAAGTVAVGSAMWAIVAGQRIGYNRHDESTIQAPKSDAELRFDDSGLCGFSLVDIRYEGGECGCVHAVRAGWCRHHNGAPGGGSGQRGEVGLEGNFTVTATSVENIPYLGFDAPTSDGDLSADSAKLEEV